jgi:hypothetical protein
VHNRYGNSLIGASSVHPFSPFLLLTLAPLHHVFLGKGHDDDDGDDDDKKKRRRKIFQFILRSVLMYHGLPEALSAIDVASNSSLA